VIISGKKFRFEKGLQCRVCRLFPFLHDEYYRKNILILRKKMAV